MNKNFAFGKTNYLLLIAGFCIILLGFILMSGSGSTEEAFNPDIFSTRRIIVAPMVCLGGFLFIIFAILWTGKEKDGLDTDAAPQAAPAPQAAAPQPESPQARPSFVSDLKVKK